jgi:hypothetical protein
MTMVATTPAHCAANAELLLSSRSRRLMPLLPLDGFAELFIASLPIEASRLTQRKPK